jgi:hypothetical protein
VTATADQGIARAGYGATPASSTPASDAGLTECETRPSIANRTVLIYMGLALIVLAPGLVLWAGIEPGADALTGRHLARIREALHDIRFGSGLRFWLGVSGASMLALLLLYPLRKVLGNARGLGRIGAWFHLHIVLGTFGPVLILYHCNFGLGGRNANVALWSMLIVALSGLLGHFVYTRVSAEFYGDKKRARDHLDAIRAALVELDVLPIERDRLLEALEAFDARQLMPRQGIAASLRARLEVEEHRRQLAQGLSWLLAEGGRARGLPPAEQARLRRYLAGHARDYFRFVRRGAGRSLREALWARWRLFHLPFFIIMAVAAVLHVVAVWDMDGPAARSELPGEAAPGKIEAAEPAPAARPQQRIVRTIRVEETSEPAARQAARPSPDKARSVPTAPATPGAVIPGLIAAPQPVAPPSSRPVESVPAGPRPAEIARAKAIAAAESPKAEPRSTQPAIGAAAKGDPVTGSSVTTQLPAQPRTAAPSPPPVPHGDLNSVYAELERRTDAQMMSLGASKDRSLAEQIAFLKGRMAAKEFAHSLAETGFALTGKHTRVECADCHKKPLRETRQPNPRQCVACHKKDDVHRGRRPDCAQCHTTNRWSERLKR